LSKKKIKIGIIQRGKYGKRAEKRLRKAGFIVISYEIPEKIPVLIDDIEDISIPPSIFDVDILLSYALHPDINAAIIEKAEKLKPWIIIPGGAKAGSRIQLRKLAKKKNVNLILEDICCSTPKIDDPRVKEFFENFGSPEFEVIVRNGVVKDVIVKRETLCGSARFIAEKLKGTKLEEASTKAGFLAQINPCWASRGMDGKIHVSASLHKKAMEKAINKAMDSKGKF
jgi:hypothetical protein